MCIRDRCEGDQILNLSIYPQTPDQTVTETICEGETFPLAGQIFNQSGTFVLPQLDANGCGFDIILNLTVENCGVICDLECFYIPVSPSCNGTGGSATLIGTGGTLPYTYDWSDGQMTQTSVNLPAGVYGVTITDANGCQSIAQVSIEEDPACQQAQGSISIDKLTNGIDDDVQMQPVVVITPGSAPQVEWTYVVTNTGGTTLTDIQVVDDIEGFICAIPSLAPGQSQTCTHTGTAELGFYENIGSVTGVSPDGPVADQDTSSYIGAFINVEKTADRTCVCPGETVDFTLTIRLLGGAPGVNIRDISVVDSHLPGVLDINSPEFVVSSDIGGDGRINFIDANGDGISDEEFLFRYTLTIDEDITNTAMDQGMLYFEDTVIDQVNNSSSVSITTSDSCCAPTGACDIIFKPSAVADAQCGESDGGINISFINGIAPFNFAWSNGATTEDLRDVAAGSYTVTITDAGGCTASETYEVSSESCGQIGNLVWEDLDSDGVQDANEPGIPNVQVQLLDALTEEVLAEQLTNANGEYCFENVGLGDFRVRIVTLPTVFNSHVLTLMDRDIDGIDSDFINANGEWISTLISLTGGEINKNIDAGFYEGNSIGNQVWFEADDGLIGGFDATDSPVADVQINLFDADADTIVATLFTDPFGRYLFENVPAGDYYVEFIAPQGMTFINPNDLGNDADDSDAVADIFNPQVGRSQVFSAGTGNVDLSIDAGLRFLPTVLAIEILDLAVSHDADRKLNVLDWTTTREVNSDYFGIERSIGNVDNFEEIDTENASEETASNTEYFYNDRDLAEAGTYYYRLKMVDLDGSYVYSNIVSVEVDDQRAENQKVLLDVYPNPVTNVINIDLTTEFQSDIDGGIYDAIGQLIEKIDRNSVTAGKTSMKMNISHLNAGTYLLRMQVGKQVIFEKVTKAN